ncbi:hypothetical protein ACIQ7D_26820 [Streptomyces sp. NPDC096310]|uniref:hypothetical protein n=1 Tax=Streptomyces sp. NPDC096310 TaxID=3366082 RepID=UPI0037F34F3B
MSRITRAGAALAVLFGILFSLAPAASAAPGAARALDPSWAMIKNQQSGLCIRLQDAKVISDCFGPQSEMYWIFTHPVAGAPTEYRHIKAASWAPDTCVATDRTVINTVGCYTPTLNPMWVVVRYEPAAPPAGMVGLRMENLNTRVCLDTRSANNWQIYPNACSQTSASQQWNIPLDVYNRLF